MKILVLIIMLSILSLQPGYQNLKGKSGKIKKKKGYH